ncbi:hypothetical protein EHS25_006061 [Saitozyma podzolica]|uniref:Uncharacterized protein n=1 Tax=Saitozyma podzolica TaxID=1890683 RepID=A0A427XTJ6_9TREE|nr:hypothetical protein EHS25_006061 [Saitozyma podzolica]
MDVGGAEYARGCNPCDWGSDCGVGVVPKDEGMTLGRVELVPPLKSMSVESFAEEGLGVDPLDGVGLTRGATPVEFALMGRAGSSRSTRTSLRTSTSFSSGLLRLTVPLPLPCVPPVRVLAVDPEPRLDPDANLLIEPGPDDAEPEPDVDDADAEPIGNLPSLSLALFRLVGAAAAPHSHFPSGTPPAHTSSECTSRARYGVGGGVPYRAHVDDLLASPVIEGDGFAVGVTSDEMAKVEVG